MLKSITNLLFAVINVSILYYGCKKTPKYYYIPKELKNWGLYNVGSYWIYQNDSTLETDSIYVKSVIYKKDSIDSDKSLQSISETIIVNFSNKNDSIVYSSKIESNVYSNLTYLMNNKKEKYRTECIILRFNSNKQLEDSCMFYYTTLNYLSYNINNNIYSDVLDIKTLTTYYSPIFLHNFYNEYLISKEKWIIKKKIKTKDKIESWSLLKCNVNK